ncbi:MAG TPA: AbrB/MazE/SpoVT family DNA-binding domain-containing protein [Micromonosporaceae bacterium]|jgi:AbrB family looped-hinge helix DNA binding protein
MAESKRSKAAATYSAAIRQKGVITIPLDIRRELHLGEGDQLLFTVDQGRIVLTPAALVPRDQAWFWTGDWQRKELEADAELAAGEYTHHATDEEFLASLDVD